MKPITISLCMIVRNEEPVLGRCLDSVKDIADEIVVVDTGSDDHTRKVAGQHTERVYDFPWVDDFAAARNFSFSLATQDYILWLDADDVILEADRVKLLALKSALDVDSVTMPYHLAHDENGRVTLSLRRNRLVRRSRNFRWVGAVHEYLDVKGCIINSGIAVTHLPLKHHSDRNLCIYESRLARGESLSPRDLYYYANELMDHGQPEKAVTYFHRFLATGQGWVEDNIAACGRLADYYLSVNDDENYLAHSFKSFTYDTPRAEFCCRLGYHFLQQNQLPQAIFWYKLATQLENTEDCWGLVNHACWTWLPHLQLCVCYYRAGDLMLAARHNEMAAAFVPDHPSVLHNRQFFREIRFFEP